MALLSRAMRAFMVVAEELHFGRAAARLNISQPPLSQLIRQFEARVGTDLFVRTTRSVRLTHAGEVLLQRARRMAEDNEAALQAARRAGSGDVGKLALGFVSTAAYRVLPRALARYREAYPEVELTLCEELTGVLTEKLLDGSIDLAIFRRLPRAVEPELVFERVHREQMVLAIPASHPFSRLDRIPIAQLDGQPFVGFHPEGSSYFHATQTRLFREHHVRPRIVYESVLPTLLALVEAGMGLALVPESAAGLRPSGVAYRQLSGMEQAFDVDLYCARRPDNTSPTALAFARILHEGAEAAGQFSCARAE
ncbi:Hca operon transcriptional activator [compost metagenome]